MRIANILAVGVLLLGLSPAIVRAETTLDPYADSVKATSVFTYAAENSVGAPDGVYAEFHERLGSVSLDMGEGEEGSGNLTMTYQILSYGAAYSVEFLNADETVLQTTSASFPIYSTETTVAYDGVPYRYVRIACTTDQLWKLDAIEAESYAEPADEQTTGGDSGAIAEPPASDVPVRGSLVKLADDGDAATTVDQAVYEIGSDGARHAFPSEIIFKTWYENFDSVESVGAETLASYPLGKNVTVRPGTWLVKITTDPKVYAIEPGGTLRWVSTEAIAVSIYGWNWAARVIDVPDTFWGNYTLGHWITTYVPPAGSIGTLSTGEDIYVDADGYRSLPFEVFTSLGFSGNFLLDIGEAQTIETNRESDLAYDPNIAFPY